MLVWITLKLVVHFVAGNRDVGVDPIEVHCHFVAGNRDLGVGDPRVHRAAVVCRLPVPLPRSGWTL